MRKTSMYKVLGLSDPVKTAEDKWLLLPVFLKAKGLVKQHIDSLDYFVNHDLRNLLNTNNCVTSDVDPKVFLVYTNIYVGMPEQDDHGGGGGTGGAGDWSVTPQNAGFGTRHNLYPYLSVSSIRGGACASNGRTLCWPAYRSCSGATSAFSVASLRRKSLPYLSAHSIRGSFRRQNHGEGHFWFRSS